MGVPPSAALPHLPIFRNVIDACQEMRSRLRGIGFGTRKRKLPTPDWTGSGVARYEAELRAIYVREFPESLERRPGEATADDRDVRRLAEFVRLVGLPVRSDALASDVAADDSEPDVPRVAAVAGA